MTDTGPKNSDNGKRNNLLTDRLYDIGFFFVEAFAALEVTAVIVANARITESLGLREEVSSYIINSYLYPLFVFMLIALLLSRWISRTLNPMYFFLSGLTLFAVGNLLCFVSPGASCFFTGRVVMGIGGAIAFAGQLWTLSIFHRKRLTATLIWGEAGTAVGVVAGPIVGALFVQFSPEGWRNFFLLNAALGLATATFAYLGLWHRPVPLLQDEIIEIEDRHGRSITRIMTAWQVAVSILIVGAEYLFSDYLQIKIGKSPLFVGMMTMLASVGAILGSLWAARLEKRMDKLPSLSAFGLLASLAMLAICLATKAFFVAGIPIFTSGVCMGLASVSIYASIVMKSSQTQFLRHSMIYLIGMQIGNALGIQAVGFAEWRHLDVLGTAAMVAVIPVIMTGATIIYARSIRLGNGSNGDNAENIRERSNEQI